MGLCNRQSDPLILGYNFFIEVSNVVILKNSFSCHFRKTADKDCFRSAIYLKAQRGLKNMKKENSQIIIEQVFETFDRAMIIL